MFKNQKGFVHLLGLASLVILLVGAVAGTLFLKQGGFWIFKSKASNESIVIKSATGEALPEKDGVPVVKKLAPPAKTVVKLQLYSSLAIAETGALSNEQAIDIPGGFFFFGLTSIKEKYTAEDLLAEINKNFTPESDSKKVVAIYRWNKDQFTQHVLGRTDDNFPLQVGEGYIVKALAKGSSLIEASLSAQSVSSSQSTLSIHPDRSLISLPFLPEGIVNAEDLLKLIDKNNGSSVYLAAFSGGKKQTHKLGASENNFPLTPGVGYYLLTKAQTEVSIPLSAKETKISNSFYKLANAPNEVASSSSYPYLTIPTELDYTIPANAIAGLNFIWVEFTGSDGKTETKSAKYILETDENANSTATPSSAEDNDIFKFDSGQSSNTEKGSLTLELKPTGKSKTEFEISVKFSGKLADLPLKVSPTPTSKNSNVFDPREGNIQKNNSGMEFIPGPNGEKQETFEAAHSFVLNLVDKSRADKIVSSWGVNTLANGDRVVYAINGRNNKPLFLKTTDPRDYSPHPLYTKGMPIMPNASSNIAALLNGKYELQLGLNINNLSFRNPGEVYPIEKPLIISEYNLSSSTDNWGSVEVTSNKLKVKESVDMKWKVNFTPTTSDSVYYVFVAKLGEKDTSDSKTGEKITNARDPKNNSFSTGNWLYAPDCRESGQTTKLPLKEGSCPFQIREAGIYRFVYEHDSMFAVSDAVEVSE